jgi:hypothetical protein
MGGFPSSHVISAGCGTCDFIEAAAPSFGPNSAAAGVFWDRITAGWTRRGYPEKDAAGSRAVLYVTPWHQKATID